MSDQLAPLTVAVSDRYRIQREVGVGGMATVYLANDLKHDREVALKVFRPELAAVLGADRFLNEIKITARLDHPHILTLIDSGAADGFLFYVMPFVRGESLRAKLDRERQLGIDDALSITRQVASALDYAHRQGVIHRDIKPENILIQEGEAMLTDFGIAMAVKEAGGNRMTETGLSLGTPQYMSPEQATGDRNLDKRSDIYSLAAVLYEMLAGEPPHTGATVQAIIAKLMTERPTRVRVVRDTVPEGVDSAVAKALAKVPADRFATASDFANALNIKEERAEGNWRMNWKVLAPIGLAVLLALGFLFSRPKQPAAVVPVDRQQITTTGNASVGSLSPDGSRVGFAERLCNSEGLCKYQLVIQEADGSGRMVLTTGAAGIWGTQWSSDGRFLVYSGSYGSDRWGTFVVSTLGGTPRLLGCCFVGLIKPDTAMLVGVAVPGDTLRPIRLVTLSNGQLQDSLYAAISTENGSALPLGSAGSRFLVMSTANNGKAVDLSVIDRKGAVLSRARFPFDVQGRNFFVTALQNSEDILVSLLRRPGSLDWSLYRMEIKGGKLKQGVDTLIPSIRLRAPLSVSWDDKSLTFGDGPVETTLFTIETDPLSNVRIAPRELIRSTDAMFGDPSPAGDRIAIARRAARGERQGHHLGVMAFAGGTETEVADFVENMWDVDWSFDSRSLIVTSSRGGKTMVESIDVASGRRRALVTVQPDETATAPMPNGDLVLIGGGKRSIRVWKLDGKMLGPWSVPKWSAPVGAAVVSPDGKYLGTISWDQPNDSILVAKTDLETGVMTRIVTLPGEGWTKMAWLADNTLLFGVYETRGTLTLHTLSANGGQPRPIRKLPFLSAGYSFSADGRRMTIFNSSDKSDIHTITNFGQILAR